MVGHISVSKTTKRGERKCTHVHGGMQGLVLRFLDHWFLFWRTVRLREGRRKGVPSSDDESENPLTWAMVDDFIERPEGV